MKKAAELLVKYKCYRSVPPVTQALAVEEVEEVYRT